MGVKRILFVDDEPVILQLIGRMLQSQSDWALTMAASSEDALAHLNREHFDLAVLDIRMPGKDGLELLAEIKAQEHTRQTEVVMMTGMLDPSLKARALEAGAADLLTKPLQREDLLARLNSILRLKACKDELLEHTRLLEQQLVQSQKMELVGLLSAGVAHDLKNILTVIVNYSQMPEMVPAEPGPDQLRGYLGQIHLAGTRAERLVRKVLNFARNTTPAPGRCDLGQVIDEGLELLRPLVLAQNVQLDWKLPARECVVAVDESLVFQVLMNLVLNAAQATAQGGRIRVSLGDAPEPGLDHPVSIQAVPAGYWQLEVADEGSGMTPETCGQIFKPLFTTRAPEGGSGLGLWVVQHIVAAHGGFIRVSSQPGCGTTLAVCLPRVPASSAAAPGAE